MLLLEVFKVFAFFLEEFISFTEIPSLTDQSKASTGYSDVSSCTSGTDMTSVAALAVQIRNLIC